jgi:molybdopterin-containing oxidoreductase family iron-sulfur binding subunit
VEKCGFCHHRLMKARDKARVQGRDPTELEDGEYLTACTEACPNGAIIFGNIKDPGHKASGLIKSPLAFRLLERLRTEPQVYYLSRREWVRRLGDNYLEHELTGSVAANAGRG